MKCDKYSLRIAFHYRQKRFMFQKISNKCKETQTRQTDCQTSHLVNGFFSQEVLVILQSSNNDFVTMLGKCHIHRPQSARVFSSSVDRVGCTIATENSEEMSYDMTKPTKWVCAQPRLRSAWTSAQSQFLYTDSEDSDQTGQMLRLICVFAGCTVILLVLSRGGSCFLCLLETNMRICIFVSLFLRVFVFI